MSVTDAVHIAHSFALLVFAFLIARLRYRLDRLEREGVRVEVTATLEGPLLAGYRASTPPEKGADN